MAILSKKIKDGIKEICGRYPTKESAILPTLHLVQSEFKQLNPSLIEELSKEISVPSECIYSTATFYTMFHFKPIGKYHLQICRNLSCSLLGSLSLIDYLCEKLDISVDETTNDGKFTLSTAECLGACGGAPVMMVNDRYYENLTTKKIDEILEECK